MMVIARNVAESIAQRAKRQERSATIRAGKHLPGYRTFETAIQSNQLAPGLISEDEANNEAEASTPVRTVAA